MDMDEENKKGKNAKKDKSLNPKGNNVNYSSKMID